MIDCSKRSGGTWYFKVMRDATDWPSASLSVAALSRRRTAYNSSTEKIVPVKVPPLLCVCVGGGRPVRPHHLVPVLGAPMITLPLPDLSILIAAKRSSAFSADDVNPLAAPPACTHGTAAAVPLLKVARQSCYLLICCTIFCSHQYIVLTHCSHQKRQ